MPIPAPSTRAHTLLLTLLLLLLTAGGLLIWWQQHHLHHQAIIAQVGTATITRHDLAIALRNHLWRQNLTWQNLTPQQQSTQRQHTLDHLIDLAVLHQTQTLSPTDETRAQTEAEQRFQQFTKQFEPPNAWLTRATAQHLTETQLRQNLLQESRLALALEKHLTTLPDQPTEADARTYFTQNQSQFTLPETARASHLFLTIHDKDRPNREADIRAYHQRLLTNQTTLAALATQSSDDPRTQKTRGDIGWFSRDRVPPDFASKVFALTPGQLSPPFLTELGWHIVQLHEKRPSRPATFDEVKPEILAHLQTQLRQNAIQTYLTQQRQHLPIQLHPDRLTTIPPAPFQ